MDDDLLGFPVGTEEGITTTMADGNNNLAQLPMDGLESLGRSRAQ